MGNEISWDTIFILSYIPIKLNKEEGFFIPSLAIIQIKVLFTLPTYKKRLRQ
jgi:hypothetical protein